MKNSIFTRSMAIVLSMLLIMSSAVFAFDSNANTDVGDEALESLNQQSQTVEEFSREENYQKIEEVEKNSSQTDKDSVETEDTINTKNPTEDGVHVEEENIHTTEENQDTENVENHVTLQGTEEGLKLEQFPLMNMGQFGPKINIMLQTKDGLVPSKVATGQAIYAGVDPDNGAEIWDVYIQLDRRAEFVKWSDESKNYTISKPDNNFIRTLKRTFKTTELIEVDAIFTEEQYKFNFIELDDIKTVLTGQVQPKHSEKSYVVSGISGYHAELADVEQGKNKIYLGSNANIFIKYELEIENSISCLNDENGVRSNDMGMVGREELDLQIKVYNDKGKLLSIPTDVNQSNYVQTMIKGWCFITYFGVEQTEYLDVIVSYKTVDGETVEAGRTKINLEISNEVDNLDLRRLTMPYMQGVYSNVENAGATIYDVASFTDEKTGNKNIYLASAGGVLKMILRPVGNEYEVIQQPYYKNNQFVGNYDMVPMKGFPYYAHRHLPKFVVAVGGDSEDNMYAIYRDEIASEIDKDDNFSYLYKLNNETQVWEIIAESKMPGNPETAVIMGEGEIYVNFETVETKEGGKGQLKYPTYHWTGSKWEQVYPGTKEYTGTIEDPGVWYQGDNFFDSMVKTNQTTAYAGSTNGLWKYTYDLKAKTGEWKRVNTGDLGHHLTFMNIDPEGYIYVYSNPRQDIHIRDYAGVHTGTMYNGGKWKLGTIYRINPDTGKYTEFDESQAQSTKGGGYSEARHGIHYDSDGNMYIITGSKYYNFDGSYGTNIWKVENNQYRLQFIPEADGYINPNQVYRIVNPEENLSLFIGKTGSVYTNDVTRSVLPDDGNNGDVENPGGNEDNNSGKDQKSTTEKTITLTVKGYKKTLISNKKVTVDIFDLSPYINSKDVGSTAEGLGSWTEDDFFRTSAMHALVKALKDEGYEFNDTKTKDHAGTKSIDIKDYGWGLYVAMLGGDREFDDPGKSGWLYSVNGIYPGIGAHGFYLENGDEMVWHYTKDGSEVIKEDVKPNAGGTVGGSPSVEAPVTEIQKPGTVESLSSVNNFCDVNEKDWYCQYVTYAVSKGLFNGVTNDRFDPYAPMTRGMLATVLYRAAGQPEAGGNIFIDVENGSWYFNAISWAAEKGIVKGYGNGLFGVNDYVTREQIASILYSYEGLLKGAKAPSIGLTFKDVDKISENALNAVKWAVEQKIITGRDDNSIDPHGRATRAEVAAMLYRYLNR